MPRATLIAAGLLLLALGLRLSLFTVDRAEFVYQTRFGRPVAVYDGAQEEEAGLHVKWPWPIESVQRLDQRLQYFDLPGAELMTRDAQGTSIDKTLTIDAYVCWRIAGANGVDQFVRSVGTADGARALLGQRINSELGAAISALELEDLISIKTGPPDEETGAARRWVDVQRESLRDNLLNGGTASLRDTARRDYGIEIVDVRLRRISHSGSVRQAIFDRIISERDKKVAEYQSEGERQAADIRSASTRRIDEMKADAEAASIRLRGQADAEADRLRNEAQLKDPQFYSFLKKLEDYERILGDNKTLLLLSTHREMFDALFQPPKAMNHEKKSKIVNHE